MTKPRSQTRDRIVAAAAKLYYAEGIGRVSVDAVAEKAGVTKKTLYYHFDSKDDLIAAYLDARDRPNIMQLMSWFDECEGSLAGKVENIFSGLEKVSHHARWKGCGFLRTVAELASMPGHPAVQVGRRHKAAFEAHLAERLAGAGIDDPAPLAREIAILLDGAFAVTLLHRDPTYFAAAGKAAATLVESRARAAQPSG